METTTTNQLIETGGYVLISMIALFAYIRGKQYKAKIETEIILLKDCMFYKHIILKYIKENKKNGNPQNYKKYRKDVFNEINYTSSYLSTPSSIKKRLEALSLSHKEIEFFLNRIKP